jgi:amino acid transporter
VNGALFRGLTRRDIVALTLNNIVGAGIFSMPAVLVAGAGTWSVAVLLLAVALVAAMALCMVEVASRYDVTGGPMYYASAAFGPASGFVVGWLMYVSRLAAFGAIATIMLDYAAGLWPGLGTPLARAAAITVFVGAITGVNLRGVVHGAMTINVLTVIKGLPLVVLALAGMRFREWPSVSPVTLDSAALGDAALVAFFTCMGFEMAAVVAGEARDPRRDLPIGIVGGVLGAGALFVLLLLACLQTVPDLAQSSRPLADAAAALAGPIGATIVLLTGVTSCAGNLSGWMVASPRVLYALALQGDVPQGLATVHPVSRVPRSAILVSAFLVWLATVSGTFVYLATFSAIARLLTYASTCAALIALRRSAGPAPVPILLGPFVATIALLASLFALASTTGTAVRDVLIALAVGWMLRVMTRRWSRTVPAPAQA